MIGHGPSQRWSHWHWHWQIRCYLRRSLDRRRVVYNIVGRFSFLAVVVFAHNTRLPHPLLSRFPPSLLALSSLYLGHSIPFQLLAHPRHGFRPRSSWPVLPRVQPKVTFRCRLLLKIVKEELLRECCRAELTRQVVVGALELAEKDLAQERLGLLKVESSASATKTFLRSDMKQEKVHTFARKL